MAEKSFGVLATLALKRQSRTDEAGFLLKRLSMHVAPMMVARKWRVIILKEFLPKDANLLGMNVNHGQRILIRRNFTGTAGFCLLLYLLYHASPPYYIHFAILVRPADALDSFYPYEFILGTMLHELVHMVGWRKASSVGLGRDK